PPAPSRAVRCGRTPRGRGEEEAGASLPLFKNLQLVSRQENLGLGKATNRGSRARRSRCPKSRESAYPPTSSSTGSGLCSLSRVTWVSSPSVTSMHQPLG